MTSSLARRTSSCLVSVVLFAACGGPTAADPAPAAAVATNATNAALRIALAPHQGTTAIDEQIRTTQAKVRERADVPRIERLATLFIGKARGSGDPGYYRLAEACADGMPTADGGAQAAALVRGHVRHALHDFATAERIARDLVAARGLFLDQGLLGDVLLDLGRLDEAREVYQRMLDQKPCLQSYARAAQVRWLVGDPAGCRELLGLAAKAGSQRDPESLAWVMTRRAVLELQANDPSAATTAADAALALVAGYPAALLARGRAAMADGRAAAAVDDLAAAVRAWPLPEHAWAHADALRAAGRAKEADEAEAELLRTGEREDPRTFAVWLATTGRLPGTALRLAEAELRARQDAHTLDAVAIARLRNGDVLGAEAAMRRALAAGLQDARVHLHAACIAEALGDREEIARHRTAAAAGRAALLPSELQALADLVRGS